MALVILHREERVLLQHRDDDPRIINPGAWGLFGGHVEPDEEPEAGALREIEEELGLCLPPPLELFRRTVDEVRERFVYAAALPVPPENLTLCEGQGMALWGPEALDEPTLPPHHRVLLRDYFDW